MTSTCKAGGWTLTCATSGCGIIVDAESDELLYAGCFSASARIHKGDAPRTVSPDTRITLCAQGISRRDLAELLDSVHPHRVEASAEPDKTVAECGITSTLAEHVERHQLAVS
jgi:hypothetical protein